jgi:hypothetical protein
MLGSVVYSETQNRTLHVERNFFGTLSVKLDHESGTRILYHGNTIHGRQFINPVYQTEPLSYFHREGPLGLIFDAFNANAASPNVAVVSVGPFTKSIPRLSASRERRSISLTWKNARLLTQT